jgi:hypothetical protein
VSPHHPHPRHVTLLFTPGVTRIWQRHVANVSKAFCRYTDKAQRLEDVFGGRSIAVINGKEKYWGNG